MAPNFGQQKEESLPEPREGHYLQEDKDTPQYKEELKKAQTEVGSLHWLAQKTRPDIACVVAIAA
eukprot:6233261-Prorocentrum_lima.AAC.1